MQLEQQCDMMDECTQEVRYELPVRGGSSLYNARSQVRAPSDSFEYAVIKRIFDVIAVLLVAPFALPLLAFIALAVKLSSPGPAFFSQCRIRQQGAVFSMWKFRTMYTDSTQVLEEHLTRCPSQRAEWLRAHKLRNDPRVTPLGRFLRKSSLDELPQLWNVLAGSMSLVGPRPIVAAEVEKYADQFACYLAVKPGITGMWQTSGRSTLSYPQRVMLDTFYVENWGLWLDLKILVRTIDKVANCDGAY